MKRQPEPFEETAESQQAEAETAGEQPVEASGQDDFETENENGATAEDLDAVQQEIARHRDAMLRMQAESENTRKRLTREAERSRKFALERIMKDLLQVVDTMERGLEIDPESATVESLLEGQALTQKMLSKVLADHHLELVDPAGEAFNPDYHEAVTLVPSPEHEDGTVIEVLQKGYKLHDRLIRPAMVVVAGS